MMIMVYSYHHDRCDHQRQHPHLLPTKYYSLGSSGKLPYSKLRGHEAMPAECESVSWCRNLKATACSKLVIADGRRGRNKINLKALNTMYKP